MNKKDENLPFHQYNSFFKTLQNKNTYILKDKKSDQGTYIPVKITEDGVCMSEPDGKLIPQIEGRRKCDYLLYCGKRLQACYIELKGKNISTKEKYNPYDQIIDTMRYLKSMKEYKCLFSTDVENHAFIVSPEHQKIPKGIELKERALLQELIKQQKRPAKKVNNIHYVKVTPKSRYSDIGRKIICSSGSPVPIPYNIM